MDDIFHLKIPFDTRCHLAGLYQVTESPALVAVSVHDKSKREKEMTKVIEFVKKLKQEHG